MDGWSENVRVLLPEAGEKTGRLEINSWSVPINIRLLVAIDPAE